MDSELIYQITDYIDYLKSSLGLEISMCAIVDYFTPYMHILYPYNYHFNRYCELIKSKKCGQEKCVEKQKKVIEKCHNGAFYGCCWAGLEEFVFPIKYEDEILGFISVSGYGGKTGQEKRKIQKTSLLINVDEKKLCEAYNVSAKKDVPDIKKLKVVIAPLSVMLAELYKQYQNCEIDAPSSAYAKILEYVCNNYSKDFTIGDISREINYSESYIRQIFKSNCNKSVMQYVTDLRIKRAKELLVNTSYSVGEIAERLGYADANYFSALFKHKTSLPPLNYRKAHLIKK